MHRLVTLCPHCKESLPEIRVAQTTVVERVSKRKSSKVRRGLLYMLLAAVVQYFSGGYSVMNLPFPIAPIITVYLAPLLFLSGFGLFVFGMVSPDRA